MKVSVFTPSHDPSRLHDLWLSLRAQTHADFEWVVVPNGEGARGVRELLHPLTAAHARPYTVAMHDAPDGVNCVGALKRFACERSTGDLLVEVDHDDVLTPDCLESLVKAAGTESNAFAFSDCVTTRNDEDVLYGPYYGWKSYKQTIGGRTHAVNATPPVTARSLCDIYYAPDHVRAWTRAAYHAAGGHDATMGFGDDHELICRTYLAGAKFVQIPRALYVHRLHPKATSENNTDKNVAASGRTKDNYCHRLVEEWCRREGLPLCDLGGAHNCPDGYTPIDVNLPDGVEGLRGDVCDVLGAMPDNSVGAIRAFDFLEHVAIKDVIYLMNLIYRKLVPGGWLLSHTPAVCDDEGRCGRGAYQDPTHVSFWSSNNTWYYTDKNYSKYVPEIACRFQSVRLGQWYPSEWHKFHLIPYLIWDAIALKGDEYTPGPKLI